MGLAIVRSIVEAHGGSIQPKTPMEAARVSVFVCRRRRGCHNDDSTAPLFVIDDDQRREKVEGGC